jgi:hypothetical protein
MAWTAEELDTVGSVVELNIAPAGSDGRGGFPIWVVRVGDELFIRSWKGSTGSWYRRAITNGALHISAGTVRGDVTITPVEDMDDAVDDAFRAKYAAHPRTHVDQMIAPTARATTVRLDRR